MKNIFFLLLITCISVFFSSCSKEDKLAADIDGCWTSSAIDISPVLKTDSFTPGTELNCSLLFTFIKEKDINGGQFTMGAEMQFKGNDASHTVIPASVIANGTWSTLNDDEILISINPRDISVMMDSAVQSMPYSTIAGRPRVELDSATVAESIHQQPLKNVVIAVTKSIREIKRIEIDGTDMSAELNRLPLEFTRKYNNPLP